MHTDTQRHAWVDVVHVKWILIVTVVQSLKKLGGRKPDGLYHYNLTIFSTL